MASKRIKDWTTSITSFRSGDVVAVDGPSGTAKMAKADLLKETAQNALAGNVAPAFDESGATTYEAGSPVVRGGKTYVFKVDHSGAWNEADVYLYDDIAKKLIGIEKEINGYTEYHSADLSGASTGYYYDSDGNLVSNAGSSYKEITLDASFDNKKLIIEIDPTTSSNDTRSFVLLDGDGNRVTYVTNATIHAYYNNRYESSSAVHSGYKLKCSWTTSKTPPQVKCIAVEEKSIEGKVASTYIKYVATDGLDTNDGSEDNPVKTISKAVELGAETIIVSGGVYSDNSLDLSTSLHDKVTIKGKRGESVVFKRANSLVLNDGSEQLVSGYSNVYSASVANEPSISGTRKWLFFDGLDDATTAISTADANPLERGKFYRCDCTKIENTTATTLPEALEEIEASETFKWWYDSSTHTLYFNRQDSTSVYPIYTGGTGANFLKTRENQSLVLSNLEFRYGCVKLSRLNIAELYDVSAKCVNAGGAFVYDESIAVLFDHCEASLTYLSSNGDGFNGHVNSSSIPFAKYCQVTLRECWSHDNNDDGYSDHEYAEATIDGGLYEWNTKGGVTPSYGSHCVCKNVVSRHNYSGFYYTGTASEGNAGQMICYNCLSESNNRSAAANVGGFRVDGTNNKVVLIDCKSRADRNSFSCADTCLMMLYDCGYRSQVSEIYVGSGTITKIKTLIAE